MPTMAYGLMNQALNASAGNDLATQLEWEAALQLGIPGHRDRRFRTNVTGHSGSS
jgi:hypothetical protein